MVQSNDFVAWLIAKGLSFEPSPQLTVPDQTSAPDILVYFLKWFTMMQGGSRGRP